MGLESRLSGFFRKFKHPKQLLRRTLTNTLLVGTLVAPFYSCTSKDAGVTSPTTTQPTKPKQNHPPVISENSNLLLEVDEGGTLNYQFHASDPDGDPITYSLASAMPSDSIAFRQAYPDWPTFEWLTLSKTGLLGGTCPEVRMGNTATPMYLVVSDGKATSKFNFYISVKNLHNDTKVLNSSQSSEISNVTNNTITFSQPQNFALGDIVASGSTSKTPQGLLGKITSVSSDHKTFSTTPASINDAIEDRSFSISQDFSASDAVSSKRIPGVSLVSSSKDYNFIYNISNVILNNLLTINGNLSFNFGYDLNASFDLSNQMPFLFQTRIGESVDLKASTNFPSNIPQMEKQIDELNLGTYTWWTSTTPPIPIVVTPLVDVLVGVKPSTLSTLESRVTQQMNLTAGISYNTLDGWKNINKSSNTFSFSPPSLNGNTNLEVYAALKPRLVMYRGLAPSPEGNISAGLKLQGTSPQNYKFFLESGAFFGVDMGLFLRTIPNYSKQVWSYEKLLSEKNGGQPPTSTGTKLIFAMGPSIILSRDDYPQIYSINEDGSGLEKLTNFDYTKFNNFAPSGFPGQNKFVLESNKDGNLEIYSFNEDNQSMTRLTNNGNFASNEDYSPVVSPNGKQVAFVSNRDPNVQNNFSHLYVMNADGSDQREISTPGIFQVESPSWSPDGQTISFDATRNGGAYNIYSVNINSGLVTQLTNSNLNLEPSWSPDGQMLAFISGSGSTRNIYTISPNGSGLEERTNGSVMNASPIFSSDSKDIFFISNRDGSYQLYEMDLSNGATTKIKTEDNEDIVNYVRRWNK